MTENKKVLVVAVTRDNPVLLQHMFQTFEKYNPGCSCDFLIVDKYSDCDRVLISGECLEATNGLRNLGEFLALSQGDPLIKGYRTVGLSGDGYLEEIHGYDVMWGHNYVHHYGAPNFREHIAKEFKTDKEEVKKHFNEKPFLMQIDRIVKKNFEGVF
jgi:hypothetical protein